MMEPDQEDQLCSAERNLLRPYLTLNQASFREVALLLYSDIKLDQFPRDCASQVSCSF